MLDRIVLFIYSIWVLIMRISHFFIPIGYGYSIVFLFSIPFRSIYYVRTFTLVSIRSQMVATQITTWVYNDSHLDILTKYQYWTSTIYFITHKISSLIPLLMIIIDTIHSPQCSGRFFGITG